MKLRRLDPPPAILAHGVITPWGVGVSCIAGAGPVERSAGTPDLAALCGESPLRFRRMDRYSALGFAATRLALAAAPVAPSGPADPDWGLILGSSLACWGSNVEYLDELERLPTIELRPALFARTVSNAVNGEVSIAHRIGGVNETFVSGWAAGADALAEAAARLAEGRSGWILAGGVEAPDAQLARMHAARRQEGGLEWLPDSLTEAAGICLLARTEPGGQHGRLLLHGYWRGHDPRGSLSLDQTLAELEPLRVKAVLLANALPPALLQGWQNQLGPERIVQLPSEVGELGAAGAPVAVALAVERRGRLSAREGFLVLSRSIEGNTSILALCVEA